MNLLCQIRVEIELTVSDLQAEEGGPVLADGGRPGDLAALREGLHERIPRRRGEEAQRQHRPEDKILGRKVRMIYSLILKISFEGCVNSPNKETLSCNIFGKIT